MLQDKSCKANIIAQPPFPCPILTQPLEYAYFLANIVSKSSRRANKLYAPQYWPSWIFIGFVWLVIRLPFSWILFFSHLIGKLLYKTTSRRRRISEINIELCFPQLSKGEQRQLVKDHFGAIAMGIFEMAMAWWWPNKRIQKHLRIEGLEHLDEAINSNKGVLLLSPHFTCLELSGRFFSSSLKHPFSAMYRPNENPVIEYLFHKNRSQLFSNLIPKNDIRAFIRCLKDNETIWYAPDQNFSGKGHVMPPFFGIPAATNPATSRLAKISGAAAVPFEYRRLPGSQGYLMQFHPKLKDFPGQDANEDTKRINQIFEEMIKRAPEQYFWIHRRFKRPRDEATDIYRDRGA